MILLSTNRKKHQGKALHIINFEKNVYHQPIVFESQNRSFIYTRLCRDDIHAKRDDIHAFDSDQTQGLFGLSG